MFKQVDNIEELRVFNSIVEEVWEESGYVVEQSDGTTDCFLIFNDNVAVGTVEFKQVSEQTEILRYYPIIPMECTVEIDKIAILKKYRSSGSMSEIIKIIADYTQQNGVQRLIGLIEPSFYNYLKNEVKASIDAVAKPFFYKGDYVVPIITQ
ncbi:GNAT family N-acetyltransferase [Paenibacillus monticola]|uniref:GNAT family N-acetyltransferase n=1 Tax=Paenibacillus monticola TaxID=2666075 RepID=A0A7X2H2B3_9BACL|nr:GNAT family N-acetyltransferase [Paenibacillus monticola]MRN52277.1 GNAT family N-acetyltransferase [Paenibacillus monticola]